MENKKQVKIVFFLLDGIGDCMNPDLDGKTPLQYAKIPVMDKIAASGICGMHDPV